MATWDDKAASGLKDGVIQCGIYGIEGGDRMGRATHIAGSDQTFLYNSVSYFGGMTLNNRTGIPVASKQVCKLVRSIKKSEKNFCLEIPSDNITVKFCSVIANKTWAAAIQSKTLRRDEELKRRCNSGHPVNMEFDPLVIAIHLAGKVVIICWGSEAKDLRAVNAAAGSLAETLLESGKEEKLSSLLSSRWLKQIGQLVEAAKWIRSGKPTLLSNGDRTAAITLCGAIASVQWTSGSHAFAVRFDKIDEFRSFTVGVSPPDVDVEDSNGMDNDSGVQWFAGDGCVLGGGNARSTYYLAAGDDVKRIKVGSIVVIRVVFGSDGTADVSVTLDGKLQGRMARGLRGPLCPSVFGFGEGISLTLLGHS